ncbi:flagellar hook-length control protein FliK [Paenibacillus catalpae]|uniref:Flagellar hook-length control protein FliK n=1 Tax=Paenibacillus catalpae TaxID=1045775 RepID=A0A1I1UBR4_9BACL|nr:flagellar hook-length control protein FliK [Paenibacillus catalpae]SFD68311.1 flagellar hook-length control protein FliK [Paenibacillus catalpae]
MEMTIPQTASPAASSAGNAASQAKTGGSDKFQKTLESQIKSDKGTTEKSSTSTASTGNADNQNHAASGTEAGTTKEATTVNPVDTSEAATSAGIVEAQSDVLTDAAAELMEMIDQLLADLEKLKAEGADADADSQDQDRQELTAMLDQLQALLALLGIPLPVQQPTQTSAASNQDGTGTPNTNDQMVAVVNKVQDSLLQLQTAMQEGTLKQIGLQEPVQLISQQLEALKQFVQKQKDSNSHVEQPHVAAERRTEITVTTTAPAISVHLQRLSGQAVHQVALVAASDQQASSEETEASSQASEQATAVTTGQPFSDVIRQAAPQVAKLIPAVQAYVPVTDFADNMKDFIQKLDIKHGNGMSEATIQLFPKELGQVDVRITMHNGQLTALFHADNANAKDALDNQMAQLRVALQQQGLSVDKLEVTSGQSAAYLSNGQHGQGTGQQAFSNQNKSRGDGIQEDFESDVAEQRAIQDLGFGRAVNVTA